MSGSPLRRVDVREAIPRLHPDPLPWEEIVRLGDLTKLRAARGGHHHANYESGLLLYALVRRFLPSAILEIGTGRGFSSLCMAMALRDAGHRARIVTVDTIGYDEPQPWSLDDGEGPRTIEASRRQVWEAHVPADLRDRVEHRRGDSHSVLAELLASGEIAPQLVYVDGDHSFPGVRHDFYAATLLAGRPFHIVLDDYYPGSDELGVRRFVDDELAPRFDLEAVFTDRRWHGEENEGIPLSEADYAQVIVASDAARGPLDSVLPPRAMRRTVELERRWAVPRRLWDRGVRRLRRALRSRAQRKP